MIDENGNIIYDIPQAQCLLKICDELEPLEKELKMVRLKKKK